MHLEELQAVLGPLGSGSAWRYWDLLLWPDRIVGWPYTAGESWRQAFSMQVPFVRSPSLPTLTDDPAAFQLALSGRSLRVHLLHDIASIALRISFGMNSIAILRHDGTRESYSLFY